MIERVIRLGTLFSGIGSIEYALKELGIEYEIEFACDNGEVKLEKKSIDKKLKEEILKEPNLNIEDCIKKIYRNKFDKTFISNSLLAILYMFCFISVLTKIASKSFIKFLNIILIHTLSHMNFS